MGTGLQSLSQVTGQDMAKVLCILAMASTLSAAPTSDPYYGSRPRINSAVDAESVVESVMRTLGPEMDAAIEAAMRGLSSPVTGFSSGLRGLSRSAPVTNFRGTVSSSPAVTVHLSGSSRGENSHSKWSSQSSSEQSNFESHSTSGIGSNFGSSSFGATGFGATGSGSSSSFGSTSQSKQEAVVDSVLSQLGPSITAAVEAALASSQSSSSQQSFQAQQSLQAQKAQQAQSFQQSQFSSSSSSQSSESELVSQIIAALTPSITQSVSAALAGQTSTSVTTITQQQQAQAAAAAAQAQAEAEREAAAAQAAQAQAAAQAAAQQVLA